jgi:hypothetical protein
MLGINCHSAYNGSHVRRRGFYVCCVVFLHARIAQGEQLCAVENRNMEGIFQKALIGTDCSSLSRKSLCGIDLAQPANLPYSEAQSSGQYKEKHI